MDLAAERQRLQIRKAQLKSELDHLVWRRNRVVERCDALAGEIDAITVEMAAIEIIESLAKRERQSLLEQDRRLLRMMIEEEKEDGRLVDCQRASLP